MVRQTHIPIAVLRFRKYRADDPPADTGCDLSPTCLECPLPKCRYDMTQRERSEHGIRGDGKSLHREKRLLIEVMLKESGKSPREISKAVGVTAHTVRKIARGEL
jgi:hypothetical protein